MGCFKPLATSAVEDSKIPSEAVADVVAPPSPCFISRLVAGPSQFLLEHGPVFIQRHVRTEDNVCHLVVRKVTGLREDNYVSPDGDAGSLKDFLL
jgi:hypothetical protein